VLAREFVYAYQLGVFEFTVLHTELKVLVLVYTVAVKGTSANGVSWQPTWLMRQGHQSKLVAVDRDIWNPVAPDSALTVSVLETITHSGDPVGWTFLGCIEKPVAEVLGPMVTAGLIRLAAAYVHWHTYTTSFMSSWLQ
jgi:hypothetical protein